MQVKNKILDDLAKTATGFVGGIANIKGEVETAVHTHIEKIMSDMDMVGREEFLAVKKMASKARLENEELKARIEKLEGKK